MSEMTPGEASAFRRVMIARADDMLIPEHDSAGLSPAASSDDQLWRRGDDRGAVAALILDAHRARSKVFPDIRLGDPNWDIMLDLYVAAQTARRVSISDVCVSAGVPISTALRHVNGLIDHDYMVRVPDPMDRRRTFLGMTYKLSAALEAWFDRNPFAPQWSK